MNAEMRNYFDVMMKKSMYSNPAKLQFHMSTIFNGTVLVGKRVLDIGGGKGLYSFYCAARGAQKVVCVEPEGDGGNEGVHRLFHEVNGALGFESVELQTRTLQQFDSDGETFDVILLHNSVNHLDEQSCVDLLRDEGAREIYLRLFRRLYDLAAPDARLVVCDCSRYNFFALLKLHNPFAPTIEWHKHQAPRVWARLLEEAGFTNPTIRWSSFNRLGTLGRLLLGNKFTAYFLRSHFCLTMKKL